MRSFLVIEATMALAATATAQEPVIPGTEFGGPHGKPFADSVKPGESILSISIRGMERVDCVNMTLRSPYDYVYTWTVSHGGSGGEEHQLTLRPRHEYIDHIEWYTDKHKGHTRVFYLGIHTNLGRSLSAGTKSGIAGSENAPHGYHLGGFKGASGREVDRLQALWSCLDINCWISTQPNVDKFIL